ncbi:hypothetical protein LEMLEM_LOCUS18918 [Lemmus lemmus]
MSRAVLGRAVLLAIRITNPSARLPQGKGADGSRVCFICV